MGSGLNVSGSRASSFSEDDVYQKVKPPREFTDAQTSTATMQIDRPDYCPLRQPIIRAKSCQNLSELLPFLSHLSVVMYEGSYALSGQADMEACEKQVLHDIFCDGVISG